MTNHDEQLPRPPHPGGELMDAQLRLLDRQIIDAEGVPVMVVDDLELSAVVPDDGRLPQGGPAPRIVAMLSGPVLATRIFGGRPPTSRLHRILWKHVREVGPVLSITVRADELDATWTERWVREHIIAHIPGGRHDPH